MISYYEGGLTKTKQGFEISLNILQSLIKSNPFTEQINKLRTLEYRSKEYDDFKDSTPWPCCKPHGVFKNVRNEKLKKNTEKLMQLSGYLYFDVDNSDIPSDYKNNIDSYKKLIIGKYPNIISMLGKSIGGRGIFFLIKVNLLTEDNFKSVHDYFRTVVFKDISIDTNALGIARNFFIPLDENLYINENSIATYPKDLSNSYNKHINSKSSNINCTGQYNNNGGEGCNILTYTFLPFADVNKIMIKETPVDVGNANYIVKNIQYSKLFIPQVISDGTKHKVYRAFVNSIKFNNPSFNLQHILSYINYINYNHTAEKPMKQKEMIRTVTAEYNRLIETGEFHGIKNKKVHTNKNLPRYVRRGIANKVNGELRKEKSILAIQIVVDDFKTRGIKPTISDVAHILKGRLGVSTIKKYWRIINPKVIVEKVETALEQIQLPAPIEIPNLSQNNLQISSLQNQNDFYQARTYEFAGRANNREVS